VPDYEDLSEDELEATIARAKAVVALGSPFRFVDSFVAAVAEGRLADARMLMGPECDPGLLRIAEFSFIASRQWSVLSVAEEWPDGRQVVLVMPAQPARPDGAPSLIDLEEIPEGLPIVVSHSDGLGWVIDGSKPVVLDHEDFMAPGAAGCAVRDFVETLLHRRRRGRLAWMADLEFIKEGRWRVARALEGSVLGPDLIEAWIINTGEGDCRAVRVALRYVGDTWRIESVGETTVE
jgi:hypothetical protein